MKLILGGNIVTITLMESKFYLRIPGPSFYENPYERESICYSFDLSKGVLDIEKRILASKSFKTMKDEKTIPENLLSKLKTLLNEKHLFVSKCMESYVPADGKRFLHSVFSYGDKKILYPDYLNNFGSNDIFVRYEFYPERERVSLYAFIRELMKAAFEIDGYPEKEFPTSNKIPVILRRMDEDISLE